MKHRTAPKVAPQGENSTPPLSGYDPAAGRDTGQPAPIPDDAKKQKHRDLFRTTYHRDHTVTIWNVYTQLWMHHITHPSDRVLASLSSKEREKVIRHCRMDDGGRDHE